MGMTLRQGMRTELADASEGCQLVRQRASLCNTTSCTVARREAPPNHGSQGCSHVWMGTVSVSGFHASTAVWSSEKRREFNVNSGIDQLKFESQHDVWDILEGGAAPIHQGGRVEEGPREGWIARPRRRRVGVRNHADPTPWWCSAALAATNSSSGESQMHPRRLGRCATPTKQRRRSLDSGGHKGRGRHIWRLDEGDALGVKNSNARPKWMLGLGQQNMLLSERSTSRFRIPKGRKQDSQTVASSPGSSIVGYCHKHEHQCNKYGPEIKEVSDLAQGLHSKHPTTLTPITWNYYKQLVGAKESIFPCWNFINFTA